MEDVSASSWNIQVSPDFGVRVMRRSLEQVGSAGFQFSCGFLGKKTFSEDKSATLRMYSAKQLIRALIDETAQVPVCVTAYACAPFNRGYISVI